MIREIYKVRFHVRKDVAPLKRVSPARDAARGRSFPRSEGRGSIEATTPRPPPTTIRRFHVRKDVAPLKQVIGEAPQPRDTAFPRSEGRGSIEAGSGRRC